MAYIISLKQTCRFGLVEAVSPLGTICFAMLRTLLLLGLSVSLERFTLLNKTSIHWTLGSQIYGSNKKIIFGQKMHKS